MLSPNSLHDYQRRAAEFALATPHCALWLGLGLGKTVSTLTALAELVDGMEINKALVIAPLRVANTVWAKEAANWQHTAHLRVSVCTGAPAKREAALAATADVYVINRENVPWLVKYYGKAWPFDCVVIDEVSSFKNSSSQRFRALKRVRPKIDRLIELTGTMAPNGLIDLWAQAYLIDQGQRLCRTKTAFLQKWFDADFMGYNYTPRPGADEQIHAALEDVVLTMTAEDYLDMPERIDTSVPVRLPAKARTLYDRLEKEFMIELESEDITALSAAALANKLLQVCNGFAYDEEGSSHDLHSAKLDALADIVEDNTGENLLIAYNYKTDLARLQERFPQAVVLDKEGEAIAEWNAGRVPLLLAHPASAGHGLNLQAGGSTIVWYGLNWSLELYEQFNGRLHRQGQERTVKVVHLVAEGCIDEKVMKAIQGKARTQQDLIDALKEKGLRA